MIGVFLLTLPLLVWSLRRLPGRSAAFLLCATWLRLLLAALHPYTYPPIAAGLSLNALGSIVAVMVGVLLLDLRLWRLKRLWTLYLLIASCVLSALFNVGPAAGAVMVITKYMFLATMTVAAYDVFTRHKAGDVFLARPLGLRRADGAPGAVGRHRARKRKRGEAGRYQLHRRLLPRGRVLPSWSLRC